MVHTTKLVRFYEGVDGLKTGYTNEAGYCLTATAERNKMRLIAIVYGEADSSVRNHEISKMLDYGFNVYETEKLLAKDRVVGQLEVIKGKKRFVNVVPLYDLNLLSKKGELKQNVTYEIKINKDQAPLLKGMVIGEIKVKDDQQEIGKVEITVAKDIKKANLFELYLRYLGDIIKGDFTLKNSKKLLS